MCFVMASNVFALQQRTHALAAGGEMVVCRAAPCCRARRADRWLTMNERDRCCQRKQRIADRVTYMRSGRAGGRAVHRRRDDVWW